MFYSLFIHAFKLYSVKSSFEECSLPWNFEKKKITLALETLASEKSSSVVCHYVVFQNEVQWHNSQLLDCQKFTDNKWRKGSFKIKHIYLLNYFTFVLRFSIKSWLKLIHEKFYVFILEGFSVLSRKNTHIVRYTKMR